MKILGRVLVIAWVCSLLFIVEVEGCTRLFWNDNGQAKLVARTMDLFISDDPQLWINPRGMHHKSSVENGLEWISLYGNVAISAFRVKDMTVDGLNEHGLAVHSLALTATEYETRDGRPGVHYGEWLQYLLDTCQTVEEALAAQKVFQVVPIAVNGFVWPIHLMMEDATGDSAIVEFVKGEMKVYHGPQWQVGTNDPPYDKQLDNLAKYETLPTKTDSVSRFVLATAYLKELPAPQNIGEAIALIQQTITRVFQHDNVFKNTSVGFMGSELRISTLWNVIADLTHCAYYFFPAGQPCTLRLDLSDLDFSEGAEVVEVSLIASSDACEKGD